LAQADIVISSVSAPQPVLTQAHVQAALAARKEQPQLLIDLGMPRNIEPLVGSIAGVTLLGLDQLRGVADQGLAARQAAIPAVQRILAEEREAIADWLAALSVQNTVTDLRAQAEAIRQAELTKALRRLGFLSERERAVIEAMSQGIVNKMLHAPTVRLKSQARNECAMEYAQVVRELFALEAGRET
jgi:glutamyl-tRNA reductase